ncbi:hypothetical protein BDZ85DRAFT_279561 [Elsinoe ampelina]|uniref:PH domain-containing protein n=1 Tax=Elsinoe ampelina TaxID=302913 RepID=A0A6A6GJN9_9PEZI|nr:hypothetical protein BDZ85DRAFT_279561 [Elsinoe ampelina]
MAGVLVKMAAKKVMGKQMKQYQDKKVGGTTDPYFTKVIDPRTGKEKKMKKQIPDYIPDNDALILAKMRNRSYKLDMCLFEIAGVRFGWSSVIGLVPAFGDAADAALALLLVWRCSRVECGLGGTALFTMLLNVLLDFVVGLVPFIGDLADAAFKANTKNVRVLEKRLDEVYKPKGLKAKDAERQKKVREERRRSGMPYVEEYENPPATVVEDFSDDEKDERRRFVEEGRAANRREQAVEGVSRPQRAYDGEAQPKRGKWYNGVGGGDGAVDEERGEVVPAKPTRKPSNRV